MNDPLRTLSQHFGRFLINHLAPSRMIRASYGKLPKPEGWHNASVSGFEFDVCPSASNVDAAIYYHGIYEAGTNDLILKALPEQGVFWDVGAYIGLMSALASQKAAEVHAFEPHPGNRRRLEQVIAHNQLNVTIHPFGLSDRPGTAVLSETEATGADTMLPHTTKGITVEVRTIDDVVATVNPPDVMKIDVEGWEDHVLEGGRGLLSSEHAPLLVVEHSQIIGAGPNSHVLDFISSINSYNLFRLRRGKEARGRLVPLTRPPRHDNVFGLLPRHVNLLQDAIA